MKKNIKIQQGSTFEWVVRWESKTTAFAAITAITKAAPPVITAPSHGIPDGWRAAIANIRGMTQLNAEEDPPGSDDFYEFEVTDANTLSPKGVDATGFGTYVSGGVLRFFEPVDLAGYTARMHIRQSLTATTTLLELNTENSRIAIDNTAKTITLTISATDTAALTFTSGVYSLELVSGSGEVVEILYGTVTLVKEITR